MQHNRTGSCAPQLNFGPSDTLAGRGNGAAAWGNTTYRSSSTRANKMVLEDDPTQKIVILSNCTLRKLQAQLSTTPPLSHGKLEHEITNTSEELFWDSVAAETDVWNVPKTICARGENNG